MKDEVSSENLRGERGAHFGLDSQAWLFNENMTEPQSLPASRHSCREVNKRERRGGLGERDGKEEEEERRLEPWVSDVAHAAIAQNW